MYNCTTVRQSFIHLLVFQPITVHHEKNFAVIVWKISRPQFTLDSQTIVQLYNWRNLDGLLGIHTEFMDGPLSSATHHMTLSIACESFTNGMHVLPYTNAVYYAPMWNKCKWSTGICREKFRGQHCTSMLSSCSSYVVSVDLIFSNCELVV